MITLPNIRYIDWTNSVSATKHITKNLDIRADRGVRIPYPSVLWTVNGRLSTEIIGTDITSDLVFYNDCNITIFNSFIIDDFASLEITFMDSVGNNATVKIPYNQSVKVTTFGDFKISITFNSKTSNYIGTFNTINPILNGGLSDNIEFGEIEYDKEKVCKVFDSFYSGWFINDSYENFANELQNCYDMNKDNIDNYFKLIANYEGRPYQEEIYEFGPKTVKDNKGKRIDTNKYGERATYSNEFNYPINDTMENSNPSNGSLSKQKEITGDETTYGEQNNSRIEDAHKNTVKRVNNTNPVGNLKDNKDITSFYKYFIYCFKDCFTMFEMMSW